MADLQPIDESLQKKIDAYLNGFRGEMGRALPRLRQCFNVVSFPEGVVIDFNLSLSKPDSAHIHGEAPSITEAFNVVGADIDDILRNKDFAKIHKAGFAGHEGFLIIKNHAYLIMGKQGRNLSPKAGRKDARAVIDGFIYVIDLEDKKKQAEKSAEAVYRKAEMKRINPPWTTRLKKFLNW